MIDNVEWFKGYDARTFFDEVFKEDGLVRESYRDIVERFNTFNAQEFQRRKDHCELSFRNQGITFAVSGDPLATERTFPFDFFPRVIAAEEWKHLEKGLIQRVKALNLFLYDIYHEQEILGTGLVPAKMILGHSAFRREVHGIDLPFQTYTHVAGVDLVKDGQGNYLVLEDNLRIPSGASYMLANRGVMARIFPHLIAGRSVQLTQTYPDMLLNMLRSLSPRDVELPNVVLLTPGPFNSAYFEHLFLAQQMGIELVEGHDLYVDEGRVWMKTTQGRQQVDVIYRRVDEDFLDPVQFRPDSVLGVRGLVEVYRQGRVALANAIGTGVADDKAVYTFVPDIIRFYLNEEPILNNVPTWMGEKPEDLDYILKNAPELVIKRVDGAGGYGMLIGPHSTASEISVFMEQVKADPTGYIAQPVIALSTHPTWVPEKNIFCPRHVDLRPFVLSGETIQVVPGGLTRVALREGSLVVNSSQGGGSKDTWVLGDSTC